MKLIILYDGVCGLCNRLNQFLLKRDVEDRFRFASLQSDLGRSILQRHGANPDLLDTFYVVENYDSSAERLLSRSDAALRVVDELRGAWKIFMVGKLLPHHVRDFLYNIIARNRYKVFGQYDTCLMPDARYRKKFLDV
jgi:predicted DCC family thiol-disulfide oxidoreductase YuxK